MSVAAMSVAELQKELQEAMRAGDRLRVDVLRMFLADAKKIQIDSGIAPDIAAVARKLIKQRRDSADQFARAGRDELAARENAEIAILEGFLPPAPSADEIAAAVKAAIAACSAQTPKDIGKVMAHLKTTLPAADMSEISRAVKQKLSA